MPRLNPPVLSTFAALVFAATPPATAAIVDDFNDGNDDSWSRLSPLAPFGSGGAYSFPGGAYRIEAPTSPDPGTIGPARAGSLRLDENFTNFDISVDLIDLAGSPGDTDLGLLARLSDVGLGTTDGYAFLYDVGGGTAGVFTIVRITDEADDREIARLDFTLTSASTYRLRFIGDGTNFVGTVADLAAPATPVATLTGSDATYATGAVGLLVYDDSPAGNQRAAGTFDNFTAAIPEPGSALLAGFGTLWLSARRRLRAGR